jgi:hypothetical protein
MTACPPESQSFPLPAHHGIPDDRAGQLPQLLAEARRLQRLGLEPEHLFREVATLNRQLPLPLPMFSPGGLAECLFAAGLLPDDAMCPEREGGRYV